ncbi:MAG: endonuclease/exonuclease/phosphatase family protein [Terriglobus roseus]|nr:endonuclease/exonuclease/phosphatase family protein [Terriglobus roseus]
MPSSSTGRSTSRSETLTLVIADKSRYIKLDQQRIDFTHLAINRPDMKGESDVFNRVMPRDHIAVVVFLENRMTGTRLIVANGHIFWDPHYTDVKVIQVAIMLEQIAKLADKYAKFPAEKNKEPFKFANGDGDAGREAAGDATKPAPSVQYDQGGEIPLVICGDFNSAPNTGIYKLLSDGAMPPDHADLAGRRYGNFTRDGITHAFSLKSAYAHIGELDFTNYTPGYSDVIDYVWYSTNSLQVKTLLGNVDRQYMQRVPGFPNWHFPSDHLALLAEFTVKGRKEKKAVEVDFGPQRDRRA